MSTGSWSPRVPVRARVWCLRRPAYLAWSWRASPKSAPRRATDAACPNGSRRSARAQSVSATGSRTAPPCFLCGSTPPAWWPASEPTSRRALSSNPALVLRFESVTSFVELVARRFGGRPVKRGGSPPASDRIDVGRPASQRPSARWRMFPSVFARLPIEKTFLPGSRDVAADLTFVHVGKRCLHSAEPPPPDAPLCISATFLRNLGRVCVVSWPAERVHGPVDMSPGRLCGPNRRPDWS